MDAFSTDVLNVTLQNTPDMVSLLAEVVNVKPFFGWGKVPPKWMPSAQMFSMCHCKIHPTWYLLWQRLPMQNPFLVRAKCPQNGCLQHRCSQCDIAKYPQHGISYDRGCQCKTLFWLGQSAPKWMPFRTDVLNVTLQNTPDMVCLMTEVVNVKPFFG